MNSFTLHHTTKANQMKTIYLREKKSGNFEIVTGKFNQAEHTHKFKTWTALQDFYQKLYGSKIIKAEYGRSTTYFNSFNEVKAFIKKATK